MEDVGGKAMGWGEAIRLTHVLLRDPASHIHAAAARWKHPATREFFLLADIFDAAAQHTYKKPKPYPRPYPDGSKKTFGKGTALPLDRLRATLDAHRASVEAERTTTQPDP